MYKDKKYMIKTIIFIILILIIYYILSITIFNKPIKAKKDRRKNLTAINYYIDDGIINNKDHKRFLEIKKYNVELIDISTDSMIGTTDIGWAIVGDTIVINKEDIIGYKFIGHNPYDKIIISNEEWDNIVVFYYEKIEDKKDYDGYRYTVNYLDQTGRVIYSKKLYDLTENDFIKVEVNKKFSGYKLKGDKKQKKYKNNKDELEFNFIFEKIDLVDVDYKISYIDKATNKKLLDSEIKSNTIGNPVQEKFKEIEGYALVGDKEIELIFLEYEDNEIIFYYNKLIDYKIRYINKDTNEDIIKAKKLKGKENEKIEASYIEIEGYTLVGDETINIILEKDKENEIKFFYKETLEDVDYSVRYVDKKTNKDLKEPILSTARLGSQVEASFIDIKGYRLIGDRNIKITLEKNKDNTIIFYYEKEKTEVIEPEDKPDDKESIPIYPPLRPDKEDKEDYPKEGEPLELYIDESENLPHLPPGYLAALNRKDHFAYVQGYKDNTFRPEEYITREEVAAIIFRLLDKDYKEKIRKDQANFLDFNPNSWSAKYIASLANGKIFLGYKDNTFRPKDYITRAEATVIATKFARLKIVDSNFKDIKDHWAKDNINAAYKADWIAGYKDNTFRPNDYIKRSEYIYLLNNILNRSVGKKEVLEGIKEYKDVFENTWYYLEVVEASNSHSYKEKRLPSGDEIWTDLLNLNIEM